MVRKKKESNRVDDRLDNLLADCQGPEDILGESGLLKQLSQRLVERALAGELSHHLPPLWARAGAIVNIHAIPLKPNQTIGFDPFGKTLIYRFIMALWERIAVSGWGSPWPHHRA